MVYGRAPLSINATDLDDLNKFRAVELLKLVNLFKKYFDENLQPWTNRAHAVYGIFSSWIKTEWLMPASMRETLMLASNMQGTII